MILKELFFKARTSLQARQNNLPFLTMNPSSGYILTRSFAEMFLGSPFSLPLPLLTPLGGGFCFYCLIRTKSAGVGDLSLSSRDMTEGESDWSDSEVVCSILVDRKLSPGSLPES